MSFKSLGKLVFCGAGYVYRVSRFFLKIKLSHFGDRFAITQRC